MLNKQKKQITKSAEGQSLTDVQKAIAAGPRAMAPVAHAPKQITEEDPTPSDVYGDVILPTATSTDADATKAGNDGTECECQCTCKDDDQKPTDAHASEGDDSATEASEDGEGSSEDEDESTDKIVDVEEDVNALMNGETNLTEGFKSKAKVIFEAAVKSKVRSARKELHEGYQRKLSAKAEEILATVTEQVDSYLTYVVETWIKENQVAVDSTLRTEIAEGFITSLKNVFAENYIEVPKANKDLVESLNARVADLQVQLKESIAAVERSKKENENLLRKGVIAEAAKGLAVTQASKLTELTKDTVFESVESFTKKVAMIKESYFSGKPAHQTTQSAGASKQPLSEVKTEKTAIASVMNKRNGTQVIVEGQDDPAANVSPDMKRYLSAISRVEGGNPNRR